MGKSYIFIALVASLMGCQTHAPADKSSHAPQARISPAATPGAEKKAETPPMQKVLVTKSGKTFTILEYKQSPILSSIVIQGGGFRERNPKIEYTQSDPIEAIFLAQLIGQSHDVLMIVTRSADVNARANLIALISDRDLSYRQVLLSEPDFSNSLFKGYRGRDQFSVKNGKLYREFPIYATRDDLVHPSGGKRILEYRLTTGKTGYQWVMKNAGSKRN